MNVVINILVVDGQFKLLNGGRGKGKIIVKVVVVEEMLIYFEFIQLFLFDLDDYQVDGNFCVFRFERMLIYLCIMFII